jgi:hypothetical protein
VSNSLYSTARQAFLSGAINWSSDTIKVSAVNTSTGGSDYTVNLATDQYFNIIPSAAVIATSSALTTPTVTAGVARADNVNFGSVTGNRIDALVIWKDTGNPSTSPLIGIIDTGTGLPLTPNSGAIEISWDSGANGIFAL